MLVSVPVTKLFERIPRLHEMRHTPCYTGRFFGRNPVLVAGIFRCLKVTDDGADQVIAHIRRKTDRPQQLCESGRR